MLLLLMNHFVFTGTVAWIGWFFGKGVRLFAIFRFSKRIRWKNTFFLLSRRFHLPYLLRRRVFLPVTLPLFSISPVRFRFLGAFFLGTVSFFLRPALGTVFRLMVHRFVSLIVWRMCCLRTSRRVARIFTDWCWWNVRWCSAGFSVCFSSASIFIVTDVGNSVSRIGDRISITE